MRSYIGKIMGKMRVQVLEAFAASGGHQETLALNLTGILVERKNGLQGTRASIQGTHPMPTSSPL